MLSGGGQITSTQGVTSNGDDNIIETVLSRSVEMWDPLTDRWTERASLQERRGKLGLVSLGGDEILAVAGVSGFRKTDMLGAVKYFEERCYVNFCKETALNFYKETWQYLTAPQTRWRGTQ